MTGVVKNVSNDAEFSSELANAGERLVVVDFFATWCGPCKDIAPVVQELALKYKSVVFLKVDVDECQKTAHDEGVTAMPTFNFYRSKAKLESIRGANPRLLDETIQKWKGSEEDGDDEEGCGIKGQMNLNSFILQSGMEALNESDDHHFAHCLTKKGGYLESDCDEQLILSVEFNQAVKLHSLKIQAPADKGPKTVKVFINLPVTLDFDSAERMEPTQLFELTKEDLLEDSLINLRYVKFQNISKICIFVKDNQDGEEITQIDYLAFIGTPVSTTNMSDFKRVAGKKGESH